MRVTREERRLQFIARLAFVAVAGSLMLSATPASAAIAPSPQPVSPNNGAILAKGTNFNFVITGRGETSPGSSTDDSRLFAKVATRADTQGDGTLADSHIVYSLVSLWPSNSERTQYAESVPTDTLVPGTDYWQPFRYDCDADPDCRQEGSVRSFTITTTSAPSGSPPAPQRNGPKLKSFLVNTSFVPGGISGRRFLDLAVRTGNSWGAFYRGNNIGDPAERDGENTVGFSYEVPEGAAGAEIDWKLKRYRRGKRRCRTHRHRTGRRHRHCRRGKRRKVFEGLVEKDILINAELRWQTGPAYPRANEFDLEAVLAHEFGHFVGARHASACESSPMRHDIAAGDWWRSSSDWFRASCPGSPGAARATGGVSGSAARGSQLRTDSTTRLVYKRIVIEITR
jgi:hypothetical protein